MNATLIQELTNEEADMIRGGVMQQIAACMAIGIAGGVAIGTAGGGLILFAALLAAYGQGCFPN